MQESITIVEGKDLDDSIKSQVRHLHDMCFPHEADVDASMEKFFNHVTFLHEFDECVWFLMWSPLPQQELVGMMACTEYHTSLFCFALCVHPLYRGQKLSHRIMLEAAQYAHHHRKKAALSGTVEKSQSHLVAFYMKMGGTCESTGVSGGGVQPFCMRVTHHFDILDVESEISSWSTEMSMDTTPRSSRWRSFLLYGAWTALLVFMARHKRAKPHAT